MSKEFFSSAIRKWIPPRGGDFHSTFFAHFWHISEHLSRFHVLNPMYGTCYMTGFLQGIQWQYFCTRPNYANMHKCAYLPIFGRFLCIYAEKTYKSIIDHVNGIGHTSISSLHLKDKH